MPLARFRSLDEARLALLKRPADARLPDRIRSLWNFAARAVLSQPPRGVMRFASIEDANRARDAWVRCRARALRSRLLQRGQSDLSSTIDP